MLSVQTAGCAGMERLGVPARATLNNPPEERSQFSSRQFSRMCVDTCELQTVIRSNYHNNKIITSKTSGGGSNFTHHHYHQPQSSLSHHRSHSQHLLEFVSAENGSGKSVIGKDLSSAPNAQNLKKSDDNSALGGDTCQNVSMKCDKAGASGRDGDTSPPSTSSRTCRSFDNFGDSHSSDHHQHYQYDLQQRQTLRCPHHVPLSDGEWPQDRNLQMRSGYQQSEIIRSYIKPPPNKTVKDVPEQSSYHHHPTLSNAISSGQQQYATAQTHHHHHHQQQQQQQHIISHNQSHSASSYPVSLPFLPTTDVSSTQQQLLQQQQQQQQQIPQPKCKPNVITKLFSRKSSPKSPTALSNVVSVTTALSSPATSLSSASFAIPTVNALISCAPGETSLTPASTVNSVSTSSSASSLPSAQSPSISSASSITTSLCNYGNNETILKGSSETNQPIKIISVPTAATPSPSCFAHTSARTPSLSVSVPLTFQHHSHKLYQQQQQRRSELRQYQLLSENMAPKNASIETTGKSNNCTFPTTSSENAESAVVRDANINKFKSDRALIGQQSITARPTDTNHTKDLNTLDAASASDSNLNRNSNGSSVYNIVHNCRYPSTAGTAGAIGNCLNCHGPTHLQEREEEDNGSLQQQHTL